MITVILQRLETSDAGTFGELRVGALVLKTLELPWRDNARGRSCIPPGSYPCHWHQSPRFGMVYRLGKTTPREEILIHAGNRAGDVSKGFASDVEGCILLGLTRGILDDQAAVLQSRAAVTRFADAMQHQDFTLAIRSIRPDAMP